MKTDTHTHFQSRVLLHTHSVTVSVSIWTSVVPSVYKRSLEGGRDQCPSFTHIHIHTHTQRERERLLGILFMICADSFSYLFTRRQLQWDVWTEWCSVNWSCRETKGNWKKTTNRLESKQERERMGWQYQESERLQRETVRERESEKQRGMFIVGSG